MNEPLAKVYQQFFAAFEEQLREIGFENVYAMKGGLASLMEYLSPKTAF